MKQYKTIAGPVSLKIPAKIGGLPAQGGGFVYGNAVRQYAHIIDTEAVGGWELLLIHQIEIKKLVYYTVLIGAALGAVFGVILFPIVMDACCCDTILYRFGGFFLGALLGALLGSPGIRSIKELFNMLVFVKDGDSLVTGTSPEGVPSQKPVVTGINRLAKEYAPNSYWVCKSCQAKNSSNSVYCKDCGNYK